MRITRDLIGLLRMEHLPQVVQPSASEHLLQGGFQETCWACSSAFAVCLQCQGSGITSYLDRRKMVRGQWSNHQVASSRSKVKIQDFKVVLGRSRDKDQNSFSIPELESLIIIGVRGQGIVLQVILNPDDPHLQDSSGEIQWFHSNSHRWEIISLWLLAPFHFSSFSANDIFHFLCTFEGSLLSYRTYFHLICRNMFVPRLSETNRSHQSCLAIF